MVHVRDFVAPSVKIVASKLEVCPGEVINFGAVPKDVGAGSFYQWQVNGVDAGNYVPVFSGNQFANVDRISRKLSTDIPGCNVETVKVKEVPVISFLAPKNAINSREAAQLEASVSTSVASFSMESI